MSYAVARSLRGLMLASILILGTFASARAQGMNQIGQIFISETNALNFPTIQLRLVGTDGTGNAIDFSTTPLFITHNGFPVDEIIFDSTTPVGTLTVFLIDAAGGASDQVPLITSAIKQYASEGNMKENLDYVAIYQIRTDGPQQLLGPATHHNEVLNIFNTQPLHVEDGATSLYEGVIDMIGRLEELKPAPYMASSIVLISDGTDPGTTQVQPGDVTRRALEAGIPIHTLHLENHALGPGVELGRTYLRDLSAGSRGVAAELSNEGGLQTVWARIGQFRNHALVHYVVPKPIGGLSTIEVRLADERDVVATTQVNVAAAMPSVTIDLPRQSRNLTLTNLDKPVEIQLSATVDWLDGEKREVKKAGVRFNGEEIADISPSRLGSFQVKLPKFFPGDNRLEVIITDSQGKTAISAPVIITVTQGEKQNVPKDLQPSGIRFSWSWLAGLLMLAALGGGGFWLLRRGSSRSNPSGSGGSRRRRRRAATKPIEQQTYGGPPTSYGEEGGYKAESFTQGTPFVMAHFEVLDAQTAMPAELILGDAEVRLGRSPAQSKFAFRDDITVSRLHAVLRLEGARYRIYDAGSTSGTYVNDSQIPDYGVQLVDGDEVQLGAVRLLFRQL